MRRMLGVHRSLIILVQHKTSLSTENLLTQQERGQPFAPHPMIAGNRLSPNCAVAHSCLLCGLCTQWPKAVSADQCQEDAGCRFEVAQVAGKVRIGVETKLEVPEFVADKSDIAELSGTLQITHDTQ